LRGDERARALERAVVVAFYATMKRSIIVRDYPSGPADAGRIVLRVVVDFDRAAPSSRTREDP
jgi:hypothetical protein